ncbi:MAG: cation-translocating P-type ATPase, partial [Nocardioidaceae bacterium]
MTAVTAVDPAHGLSQREAARRLVVGGPNRLPPRARTSWTRLVAGQLAHPLALLLWAAAGLSWLARTPTLAVAIVGVVLLNAVFAYAQEHQAERAVEALLAYVAPHATVVRDGQVLSLPADQVVVGDVLVVDEGAGVAADARLLTGAVEVDMSALTGESVPVERRAGGAPGARALEATDLVFSGSMCTGGGARAVVVATGGATELGRIAALTAKVQREPSPLERQVTRVARLIAVVAVGAGLCFLPLGLLAGLSVKDATLFAVGLLVANVPEGLLPTITLALAVGVRGLARDGAVVKRLSAVETLGSTTVICTDKTGTLTENRMQGVALWTPASGRQAATATGDGPTRALALAAARCTAVDRASQDGRHGDPTELGLLDLADRVLGGPPDPLVPTATYPFDPALRLMSVVLDGEVVVKGAPEAVLARCPTQGPASADAVEELAREGLRVLAVAHRCQPEPPASREEAESDLELLGLVALHDPPRPEVPAAVELCHRAGIRIHVVTGDHPDTAVSIARQVGIGLGGLRVVTGAELDAMPEAALDALLGDAGEVVFARSSPEAKLRIADALRDVGHVVAMTGDGVNDAPALH